MEEADALATRVGIISRQLLDVGSTNHLREKYGHGYHVHIIMGTAPHSTEDEMRSLQSWIEQKLPGTQLEGVPYHGQLRFIVSSSHNGFKIAEDIDGEKAESIGDQRSVASIFCLMEENKKALGIKFYSVSPSTFDEVFLKVVERHQIQEEEVHQPRQRNWSGAWIKKLFSYRPFIFRIFR
jgi:ATP-binding cassette subfamily A (ABC1) protein 3